MTSGALQKTLSTLALVAAVALPPVQAQDIETEHFFLRFTSDYSDVWTDRGSGADRDVSIWAPRAQPGYYTLGHMAVAQHTLSGDRDRYVSMLLRPKNSASVAVPTDYRRVWTDAGSGADRDVAIWNVVCPGGFISLGDVATSGARPSDPNLRCVDINYTARIGHKAPPLWTDAGSGADRDVALWTPRVRQQDLQDGRLIMAPNTFQATPGAGTAPTQNETRAMRFVFPGVDFKESITLQPPRLVSQGAPPAGTNPPVTTEYQVPFFVVDDPNYPSQLAQWRAIPYYTVERTTRYEFVTGQLNRSSSATTKTYSKTIGSEHTSDWSNALGISSTVGVSGGVKGVVDVSAEVTVSNEYSWGGSQTTSQSETVEDSYEVAPGKYAALFQVVSDYRILRPDGSVVPSTQANNRFDDTAVVEFGMEPTAVPVSTPVSTPGPTPASTPVAAPTARASAFPIRGETVFERGRRYPSPSGDHYLVWQPDGNLVVYTAGGGYVWGLNETGADLGRIGRVVMQADGNLAAYTAGGEYLWSALTESQPSGTSLQLDGAGVLRIVTPAGQIAWSSASSPAPSPSPAPAATASNSWAPASGAIAEWSGEPYFGSTTLASGFTDDPRRVSIQGGGETRNPLTGPGCVGYIGVRPDHVVSYTAGEYPLTFSAAAESDLSLVVRTPEGTYYCDDDSGEGYNPRIDLEAPTSGEYRVWVGTYSDDGGLIDSVLAISEVGRVAE